MAVYIFPKSHIGTEVISLARAKEHLKLDAGVSAEDDLISDYIQAAVLAAENYTNTNIIEAKFEIKSNAFIADFEIPLSPVRSIESIKYKDENGDDQTLVTAKYELLPADKYIHQVHYPDFSDLPGVKDNTSTAVVIAITTGYAATKVPKPIQSAILLILGDLYENRQDRAHGLPTRSKNLLNKYRFH